MTTWTSVGVFFTLSNETEDPQGDAMSHNGRVFCCLSVKLFAESLAGRPEL